jgi:hypothetical protein
MKPEKVTYSVGSIRYRHYGRILEELVKKASVVEDEAERKALVKLLAIQMKKSLNNWNKDGMEDQKIVDDLREYSKGAIDLKVEDLQLNEPQQRQFNNNYQRKQNNFQRGRQQNFQRRKQQ